jgi:hypothetical protein
MSDYPEGGFYHRQLKEILGIPLGVRIFSNFTTFRDYPGFYMNIRSFPEYFKKFGNLTKLLIYGISEKPFPVLSHTKIKARFWVSQKTTENTIEKEPVSMQSKRSNKKLPKKSPSNLIRLPKTPKCLSNKEFTGKKKPKDHLVFFLPTKIHHFLLEKVFSKLLK